MHHFEGKFSVYETLQLVLTLPACIKLRRPDDCRHTLREEVGMAYVDPRAATCYGDCSDSMPSSAASEDTLEINEADINVSRIQEAVHMLLRGVGEDISREGLRDTPKVSRSYGFGGTISATALREKRC